MQSLSSHTDGAQNTSSCYCVNVNVATDRAALSPEAEDERDEGDQASHHPDVAREYRKMMMMFIVSIISIYIGISPEDHHS